MDSRFFFAFFLFLFVVLSGCSQAPPVGNGGPDRGPGEPGTGTLVLSVTDTPADINAYKELNVTISGIEVHKTGGAWIEFSDEEKTFNLFELNGVKELFGEKELDAGKYTGIRLLVERVELIEEENGEEKIYEVTVPSGKIQLSKPFDVIEGQELELVIDFDPYSVVLANDKYILRPNIKLLSVAEFEGKAEKIMEEKEEQEQENKKVKITQVVFPATATSGQAVEFRWKVQFGGDEEVPHTAVHWDLVGSHGEDFSAYANASEIKQGRTNEEYSVSISMPEVSEETTFYFRVHAVVGDRHGYSEEMQVTLSPQVAPPQEAVEFEVLSNDSMFEPNSISAAPGDLVKISFSVPTTGVSFGGMRVKALNGLFDVTRIPPGESDSVEFTMPESSFTVSSYWPGTNIFKASMQVIAQAG